MIGDFNSHAHVERDWMKIAITDDIGISTHTLTWSVTNALTASLFSSGISTHTLTWSVTLENIGHGTDTTNFNSHAHVERDGDAGVVCWRKWKFQLTRSRGA